MGTQKALTGPRTPNGVSILGSFRAHQVPLPGAKTDDSQLKMLNEWLKLYNVTLVFLDPCYFCDGGHVCCDVIDRGYVVPFSIWPSPLDGTGI